MVNINDACVFSIFQYRGNNFLYDLQVPILASVFPLVLLAILFYLGQKFHMNALNLSGAIYQSEWYQYPHRVQRCVLLIMIRSQQPFYLSGYGMIELHLENFVSVSE